jgi:hypothetical protein
MCWDCGDNYASIKAITTCAALENMLRLTAGEGTPAKASKKEQDEEKERLQRLEECLATCQVGDRLVRRVMGVLKSSHHLQPKNVLNEWQQRGFLGVEREDITAWHELRNSVAHGDLAFNDPDLANCNINFKYQKRVENMINKLVMYAMNYNGRYFDYGRPFPCSVSMSDYREEKAKDIGVGS